MLITKGDGTEEDFQIERLVNSFRRSGASQDLAEATAREVERSLKPGMSTTEIYKSAYKLLKKKERAMAARYSMRRAILELGPTGFPFEDYFSEIMKAQGYDVKVRQILQGRCTEHEVDVVLEKDGRKISAELKFHNAPGFKTDLKTALYVRARFWDIEYGAQDRGQACPVDEAWLVTNTKFTNHAIEYAECAGIKLLGWSYPDDNNLGDMIQQTGIYPITVLSSISKAEKARLLEHNVTLCKTIKEHPELLAKAGIVKRKHRDIIDESSSICGS